MTTTLLGPLAPTTINAVGLLASIGTLLAVGPLVYLTARGRACPRPLTWLTWFAVGMVATVGMALGGAPFSAWITKLGLSLGPLVVAVVARAKGVPWAADRTDRISMALSGAGFAAYVLIYFGVLGPADPLAAGLVAVFTAMAVDAVCAVPTWRHAWSHPHDELVLTYAIAAACVFAVLLTLPTPWTWLGSSYLVFLELQMWSIIAVLTLGRARVRRAERAVVAP
jgi:hypothetical protein